VDEYWDPDKALESLKLEGDVFDGKTQKQIASDIFKENSPLAAQAIVQIALHDPDSRRRLQAATYITDRVLGRVGEEKTESGEVDPLEAFLADTVNEIEAFANAGEED
jgi:hypothetical protein